MLGYLRFILALMVVSGHLGGWAGGVNLTGSAAGYSVFGFYVISGYLITRILHERYHFRFYEFALNRFLRLYPSHFIVAIFALVVISTLPESRSFHPAWAHPNNDLVTWLCNVFIFPITFLDIKFLLTPPTWSVGVELVNYFLLWAFVGRSWKTATIAMVVSAIYHGYTIATGHPFGARYTPVIAALLPFSIGAMIYLKRDVVRLTIQRAQDEVAVGLFLTWLANIAIARTYVAEAGTLFFYANLVIVTALICVLSTPAAEALKLRGAKIVGDMAYPIFLCHWILGFLTASFVFPGKSFGAYGVSLFVIALGPILLFSYILAKLTDASIEPMRARIRNQAIGKDSSGARTTDGSAPTADRRARTSGSSALTAG